MKKLFTLALIACVAVIGCKKKDTTPTGNTPSGKGSASTQTAGKSLSLDPATVEVEVGKSADVKVSLKEGNNKVKATDDVEIKAGEVKGDTKATVKSGAKIAKGSDEGTLTIEVPATADKGKEGSVDITAGGQTLTLKIKTK